MSRGLCGAAGLGLDHGGKSHTGVRRLELAQHAQVIAAESARAGDRDAQDPLRGYWPAPLPSTAFRQRP